MVWKIARNIQELTRLYDGKAVLSIHEEETHFWVEVKENGKVGVEKVLKPLNMDKVKQVLLTAGFPPVIVRRLEETRINELIQIVKEALAEGKGLVLSGPAGVGKTHGVTFCIANALRYYKINNPLYISIPELDVRTARELYKNADLIFIDDLNFSHPVAQDITRQIVYHTYNHEKLLLIATNKSFRGLVVEILQEEPIVSRLIQMCEVREVKGEDLRKTVLK